MSLHRFNRSNPAGLSTAGLLLLASAIVCTTGSAAAQSQPQSPAQTQTTPAAPAPQATPQPIPSMPAATPAPNNDLPGMPAYNPAPATPHSSVPGYNDPLLTPIVVPPGNAPLPAAPAATPGAPSSLSYLPAYNPDGPVKVHDYLGSTYIPVDSPVYPMALRLYSMGYLDTAFINMRPWTRRSLLHMLHASSPHITQDGNDEAVAILAKLETYLIDEPSLASDRGTVYGVDTVYTRLMGINGQTLRDSYHLGQTIGNDYGRPYEPGFNAIAGFSTINEWNRFSLYVRGEYQHSPSSFGYSTVDTGNPYAPGGLVPYLSNVIDGIPYSGTNLNQATIPTGNIAAQNPFRLQEATLSFHVAGHEISGGKSDAWEGPGTGGALAWSNNAEDMYSFRINRVDPLYIPYLSRVLGTLRYDFFVGSLKGHTYPNSPWMHSEMFSFNPTKNFQFAFQRSVIWGGEGHEPVTLHTFFRSFFSTQDTESDPTVKNSSSDPGARFSDFSFSWRLPFISHFVTLYADSESHDDVSPISAPRRAAYRPGVYISQFPGLRKLDFRIEGASTDVSTTISHGGQAEYYETVQRQGYTNKGFIIGDVIGRQAKGGQAWLTYHLSGNEWVQVSYMDKKIPVGFIPGGTTQGQFMVDVVKRIRKDVELNAWLQTERWAAPIYILNPNNAPNHDTIIAAQVTWYPKLRTLGGIDGK
jgi:hypothetical protein